MADTVAWWRFEEGPHGALVPKTASGYTYEPSIPDSSGNGYELTVWDMGGAGQVYRSEVASPLVTRLGLANNFSSKNNGGGPCMWTNPADAISTMTPAQWTVEATFKLENGGHKTIVGRDARGITTDGASYDNAAMYFQAVPDNGLAIKFVDVAGYFHEAVAPANSYIGFDWGTDQDGTNAPWYSMAATSDGATLSLYLLQHGVDKAYKLIAQTDMTTVNPSPNTALNNGSSGVAGTGDWTAGEFSVARGLWAGGHGDRAYGFIDEVRISDSALTPSEFLFSEDYTNTVAYWRFEEGPADSPVAHGGLSDGVFFPGVQDVSGKGNHLSVWSETAGGHLYRSEAASAAVPLMGATNTFSVQHADSQPGLFTSSADAEALMFDMETWQPAAFTIEASFKPQSGGHRTIVGRDGQGVVLYNGNGQEADLAALYFQIQPDDSVAVKFADAAGYWHQAVSAPGVIRYDNGGRWYHMAAVSDGARLRLYLNDVDSKLGYQPVAETDITASGSPDTRLAADPSVGTNWHGGGWSVGRGLFGGNHTDRLLGYIDEVRISSAALDPNEFLFYEVHYAGVAATPLDLVVHEESATSGALFFSLDSPPADDVILTIQEQNGRGQVTLGPTMLTFTPSNWNVPQAIQVTAVDDAELENAEHRVPLSVTVSSVGDTGYDGLDVDPAVVRVADNECGAWGYAAGDFNTDCFVDFYDFVRFASGWLECSDPDQVDCTNYMN